MKVQSPGVDVLPRNAAISDGKKPISVLFDANGAGEHHRIEAVQRRCADSHDRVAAPRDRLRNLLDAEPLDRPVLAKDHGAHARRQGSPAARGSRPDANRREWIYEGRGRVFSLYLIPPGASGYGRPVRASRLRTLLIALIVAIAAILWFRWQAGLAEHRDSGAGPAGEMPRPGPTVEPVVPGIPRAPEGSGSQPAPESDSGDLASAWESVDMDEIRRVMPDNTFWTMSAPTTDERVIREREEERARWNVEYGKVLSGNASEEEIRAYYAHRQRLSADYVEFTTYVLDHHGDDLSDQDVGCSSWPGACTWPGWPAIPRSPSRPSSGRPSRTRFARPGAATRRNSAPSPPPSKQFDPRICC